MGLVLDPTELAEITGYKLPSFQRSWLEKNGWRYVQNRAGYPVVAREHALNKMGASQLAGPDASGLGVLPDFSAVRGKR